MVGIRERKGPLGRHRRRWEGNINPLNAELNPICPLLVLLGDLTFMGPCIVSIFQYTCISNKMKRYTVSLYLETADINKLCKVASCWICIRILLAHHILHISRIRVNTYNLSKAHIVAPWWWLWKTETCRSTSHVNCNVNFNIFRAIYLCISWINKIFYSIKMHGATVKIRGDKDREIQ